MNLTSILRRTFPLSSLVALALAAPTGCAPENEAPATGLTVTVGSGSTGATGGPQGSDDDEPNLGVGSGPSGSGSTSQGASTATSAAGGGSASSGQGGATSGGAGGAEPIPETPAPPMDQLGTLVVLGDSIGDGGGQGPYYNDLLPSALQAEYGPIEVVQRAQSGSKTGALIGQIASLPTNLPGPVAVVITSGGNDMKDNLPLVLLGADQVPVAAMGFNLQTAFGMLSQPDRFGPGVEVRVYQATIYDASDGVGNFRSGGCVIPLDSPMPTTPMFARWNDEIAAQVSAAGQVLAPMHGTFEGHGFNNPPKWYADDCTHPNSTGHAALSDMFFELITGQAP